MDTSNPVVASDRRSIQEIIDSQRKRRRQDLSYLGDIARSSTRYMLPAEKLVGEAETKNIVQQFKADLPKISVAKDEPVPPAIVALESGSCPISGLLASDGLPLHPPKYNNSQGSVSVRRVMGGTPHPPLGFKEVVEVFGEQVLEREYVYTNGTWKGFMTRLQEQMGRKTKSVLQSYREIEQNPKLQMSWVVKKLTSVLPRDPSVGWPRLDEDLSEHLKMLKVTASSSAGAPYWRNKSECMDEILSVGLPAVVEALKTGKVKQLYREQPEMFLCEVKNKLDRYEIARLDEKTRPYCAIPAHWAFLFSILAQRFQSSLKMFDSCKTSSNAYGFSAVGGGFDRMYDWMMSAPKRGKFCVYGDDTCLVVRKGDDVFRVDPDFKQMDGSIDKKDIALTISWIQSSLFAEDHDLDEHSRIFWKDVCKVWLDMASNPDFVLDGIQMYEKAQPHGLLSGVPGTTLFDTVKSAMAWNAYLDVSEQKRKDPLDGEWATAFMADMGLVIKPGTWSPARVPKKVPGVIITDHKFLGVQMLCEEYKGKPVIVPTIPEKDALEMMITQKDNPYDRTSSTTAKRRLYDRMRGLYLTIGFASERIVSAIHNVVNEIDPVAILMCTNLGTGEKPEHILLEDFAYPDSSGFPTREFVLSMYSEKTEDRPGWIQLYPDLADVLELMRDESRFVEQQIESFKPIQVKMVEAENQTEFPDHKEFGVLAKDPKLKPKELVYDNEPYHERSHLTAGHHMPCLGECIRLLLKEDIVCQVASVCRRFKCSKASLEKACIQWGLFLTGLEDDDLVSLTMVQTPAATDESANFKISKEQSKIVSRGVDARVEQVKQVDNKNLDFVSTAPDLMFLKEDYVLRLHMPPVTSMVEALLTVKLRTDFLYKMRKRVVVHTGEINPSEVILEIASMGLEDWEPVAACRSLNQKLAYRYIIAGIMIMSGHPLEDDIFTAGLSEYALYPSPPSCLEEAPSPQDLPMPIFDVPSRFDQTNHVDWNEEMVKEEMQERDDAWARPLVAVEAREYFPDVKLDPIVEDALNLVTPDYALQRSVYDLVSHINKTFMFSPADMAKCIVSLGPRHLEFVCASKRSHMSPQERKRRNRAGNDRRKRKKRAARLALSRL